jgi:hypothetical protein
VNRLDVKGVTTQARLDVEEVLLSDVQNHYLIPYPLEIVYSSQEKQPQAEVARLQVGEYPMPIRVVTAQSGSSRSKVRVYAEGGSLRGIRIGPCIPVIARVVVVVVVVMVVTSVGVLNGMFTYRLNTKWMLPPQVRAWVSSAIAQFYSDWSGCHAMQRTFLCYILFVVRLQYGWSQPCSGLKYSS